MTARIRAAALGLALLLLAACTSMPTAGPVMRSDVVVNDPGTAENVPEGPHAGAGPPDLVESFLIAGAQGFGDEFATAREYFAGEARETWKPLDGVVVAGAFTYTQTTATQVTIDVPVVARVDGDGRYTEAPPDARESVTYDLVRNSDGEWRIASAPDGLVLPQVVFDSQFRAASVYFLSADKTFLVPETRWFPVDHLPTYVMKALLAGPSPWLRDAVVTAVPDGAQLKPDAVQVDDAGVAQVGLAPMPAILAADRGLLLAQIDASLLPISSVGSVHVTTGDVILEGADVLEGGSSVDGSLEFLQAGRLLTLEGKSVKPVDGVGSLEGLALRHPARDESGGVRVGVSRGRSLITLPRGDNDEPATLATGSRLVAPSVDRFGWAWTATSGGGLIAGHVGAEPVEVKAAFLDGRQVRSLRVARDGTRIAIVSEGSDGVAVDVGAIARDGNGAPRQIGEVIRAGAVLTDASVVVWAEESALAVIGTSAGTLAVHTVPVAGPSVALPEVSEIASVAGGRILYASTSTGDLLRYAVTSWTAMAGVKDVLDPSYPG
jgi:hypothetical protein